MNGRKFNNGDTIYISILRINEDEVDWEVVRAACRGYKTVTSKPVVIGCRGEGRSVMAYEEDCFRDELDAISRLMLRLTKVQNLCSDQSMALNRRGLDNLACRGRKATR